MNYTPGPWRLQSGSKDVVVSDTPNQRYSITIAECSGYKTEREANALLIAAAPELFEMLKTLVNVLLDNQDIKCDPNIVNEAQQIITKAQGG